MLLTRQNRVLDTQAPTRQIWATALVVLLIVLLILTGTRLRLSYNISVGNALTLLLLPCWLPVLRRYQGAALFFGGTVVALVSGAWLTAFSSTDHQIDWSGFNHNMGLLVSALAAVGLLLWAREQMPAAHAAQWMGVGLLLGGAPALAAAGLNAWKYALAFGAAVFLLALAQRAGSRWGELFALIGLAGASAVTDSRSQFAILLFTAALVAWQMRPQGKSSTTTWVRVLLGAGVLGAILFNVVQGLLLEGALGEAAQDRSRSQIDESGSILLGGRPELAASVAMFFDRPMGYGPGTVPAAHDIEVAKNGMLAINYEPDNGYVAQYMFGSRIELHSVLGDLWARFGLPGLAFGVLLLVLVVVVLAKLLARSNASALVIYVVILTVWNLLFSPIYSSVPALALAVGLLLQRRPDESRPEPVRGTA